LVHISWRSLGFKKR